MILKLLSCVIAMTGALAVAAQTPQAPIVSAALNPIPPALRTPQADEATIRLIWQAVVGRFPEVVDGPERQGTFVIALALRPDGSVVRSDMRYAETRAEVSPSQQAQRGLLPDDGNAVPGAMEVQRKGAKVLGDRILKGGVFLNGLIVPSNWDETRDRGIVRRAVLQHHADLFLPNGADHVNLLTVVMSDNGEIARSRVEVVPVQHQGSMTTMMVTTDMARTSAVATDFTALGLEPDDVGVMGNLPLSSSRAAMPATSPSIDADGISRGASSFSDMQRLLVRYAWPRRAGEPAGGTPLAWDSVPRQDQVPLQMIQVEEFVRQYFPAGSATEGNWMLLTFDGEILRTGHVELGMGESLTSAYVERLMPGIKVAAGSGVMLFQPTPDPGEPPGSLIGVNYYFLAQDSPLPPPENIQVPAR